MVDTTAPTATIEYSTTGATNGSVIATLTGASEAITVTNNSGALTYEFVSNGTFEFQFADASGNTGATTATVANIDTVAPLSSSGLIITSVYSGTTITTTPSFEASFTDADSDIVSCAFMNFAASYTGTWTPV